MKLDLTDDQALVLFEWLARLDAAEAFPVEDPAEEQVLWCLHGQLEKVLSEPFRADYRELVEQARARVKASFGARRRPAQARPAVDRPNEVASRHAVLRRLRAREHCVGLRGPHLDVHPTTSPPAARPSRALAARPTRWSSVDVESSIYPVAGVRTQRTLYRSSEGETFDRLLRKQS